MSSPVVTYSRRLILAVLPKLSSLLSLSGSLWIIIEVYTHRKKRSNTYHRLLFCMSIFDILESIWNFAATWPIPKTDPTVLHIQSENHQDGQDFLIYNPIGNQVSCSIQGFFLQLGVAIPICKFLGVLPVVTELNFSFIS